MCSSPIDPLSGLVPLPGIPGQLTHVMEQLDRIKEGVPPPVISRLERAPEIDGINIQESLRQNRLQFSEKVSLFATLSILEKLLGPMKEPLLYTIIQEATTMNPISGKNRELYPIVNDRILAIDNGISWWKRFLTKTICKKIYPILQNYTDHILQNVIDSIHSGITDTTLTGFLLKLSIVINDHLSNYLTAIENYCSATTPLGDPESYLSQAMKNTLGKTEGEILQKLASVIVEKFLPSFPVYTFPGLNFLADKLYKKLLKKWVVPNLLAAALHDSTTAAQFRPYMDAVHTILLEELRRARKTFKDNFSFAPPSEEPLIVDEIITRNLEAAANSLLKILASRTANGDQRKMQEALEQGPEGDTFLATLYNWCAKPFSGKKIYNHIQDNLQPAIAKALIQSFNFLRNPKNAERLLDQFMTLVNSSFAASSSVIPSEAWHREYAQKKREVALLMDNLLQSILRKQAIEASDGIPLEEQNAQLLQKINQIQDSALKVQEPLQIILREIASLPVEDLLPKIGAAKRLLETYAIPLSVQNFSSLPPRVRENLETATEDLHRQMELLADLLLDLYQIARKKKLTDSVIFSLQSGYEAISSQVAQLENLGSIATAAITAALFQQKNVLQELADKQSILPPEQRVLSQERLNETIALKFKNLEVEIEEYLQLYNTSNFLGILLRDANSPIITLMLEKGKALKKTHWQDRSNSYKNTAKETITSKIYYVTIREELLAATLAIYQANDNTQLSATTSNFRQIIEKHQRALAQKMEDKLSTIRRLQQDYNACIQETITEMQLQNQELKKTAEEITLGLQQQKTAIQESIENMRKEPLKARNWTRITATTTLLGVLSGLISPLTAGVTIAIAAVYPIGKRNIYQYGAQSVVFPIVRNLVEMAQELLSSRSFLEGFALTAAKSLLPPSFP